ncbi:DVU_1551 family NTP transferase [Desulfoluna spongiiphila]|uniref:CTP:molybdopterin cytidylyltransferase MocA n=1 Tax=Desulfoluna spongiiphila TaxID=419481 RepID=A0A1G5E1Y3_9BACT|nr:NTP transferase domain-containing protein [Desulfoluna spongiiphila]SCY20986.1 CTP:molybdopterin cytidylyltransferase MocA [Desulfoluna spongiiphila]
MKKITAIILAGGKSSRMNGPFKPLLPVGDTPALERCVGMFRQAGVNEILCVTGHNHRVLSERLAALGVKEHLNPDHEEGMFSSIQAGVSQLDPSCAAFFVLPVDIPLVRRSTVERLCEAWHKGKKTILYPVFRDKRGHPPLIPAAHAGEILAFQGDGGLRAVLASHEAKALDIPVADECMLMDMDTMDDYRLINETYKRYEIPSADECRALMTDVLGVKESIIDHCRAVADVTAGLGEEINRCGGSLDLPLLKAAALLHDLARHQKSHARAGALLLRGMGFSAVAEIVAVHMEMPPEDARSNKISEAEVLFLADKHVSGTRRVTLGERFGAGMKKYGHDPEAAQAIERRHRAAMDIERKIGACIHRDLSDEAWRD